jgi:glycosyltransferase involved in cell wall biosynthesis
VVFTGLVPFESVPDYIGAMDICVIPQATWYGSPIKLFEYGAMGRPIIAPDWPPIREIMVDGETGLIVSPGTLDPLSSALVRLANDAELRQQLGQRFMERVRAEYSWERVAERLSVICSDVLRSKHGPEPLARGSAHRRWRGGLR